MNNKSTLATQLRKSIDDSLSRLASAVEEQRSSEEMKRYLDTMARFPTYSWRNAWLIFTQRPEATLVAGFSRWKRLGRNIRKGEKAIRIISPCPMRDKTDDDEEKARMFFKGACVFDVAQTEGEELPTAELRQIQTNAESLLATLKHVATTRGIAVSFVPMPDGKFGSSSGGRVEIATGYTSGQQSKTLIHELAHEAMHRCSGASRTRQITRDAAELEAEAVAYVTCRHFGLDVELRASRYIALWGGDGKALAASLEVVANTARQMIVDAEAAASQTALSRVHAVGQPNGAVPASSVTAT